MPTEAADRLQGLVRSWSRRDRRIQLLALVVGVGVVTTLAILRGSATSLKLVGYPGVFLLSLIGSGAMILPVPALASTCGMGVVLSPLWVGLIAAVGETIGELTGYAVGFGSQEAFQGRRFYVSAKHWMERHGTTVLFLVSAIPNPVFDVVGVAAGATRVPLTRFLATVWLGKSVKTLLVAYGCYHGANMLPWVS